MYDLKKLPAFNAFALDGAPADLSSGAGNATTNYQVPGEQGHRKIRQHASQESLPAGLPRRIHVSPVSASVVQAHGGRD